jgi:predicted O-linked N-acetylglucosamine transferase (SPINDLY family)
MGIHDESVAEMVRKDRIDILVDLAVHTNGNRLLVFARKPAPVQATWLGYAGTTGLRAIDWRITDAIVDPPGLTESLHAEKLFRLPRTQWCYRPAANAPPPSAPPSDRAGYVTFGNALNLAKVTPRVIEVWSAVLRAVPTSRLSLKARSLGDESTRKLVAESFAQHGVAPERLTMEPGGDLLNYFGFFDTVDICLDTFPFAGGTTTCHTLWMGVPVVTLTERTSVSRVAASVLTSIGLKNLVAQTPEQFVHVASQLAFDADRRRELRKNLRPLMRTSPLCDGPAFARDLENAYREMWRTWCASMAADE